MKYKGFVIIPSYLTGSTFTISNTGIVKDRKPTSKDIEYYEIFDPLEGMNRWGAEYSISECKQTIRNYLSKVGLKTNMYK